MEAQDNSPLANLFMFIIEKVTSNLQLKTVKKKKNEKRKPPSRGKKKKKHTDFLLKTKAFQDKKIIAYLHQNLNTSKGGGVRSQEVSLCPLEEIKKELKPQGVTDVKRALIKRDNKIIHKNTYIMTFELPVVPPKIKIGYTMERVEQFIPNPLGFYKCQKYGHHQEKCNGRSVCGKCGQKDPDHSIEECKNTHRYANCGGDHPVYSKTCEKREREILSIKYTRNISFLEAQKIVDATSRD